MSRDLFIVFDGSVGILRKTDCVIGRIRAYRGWGIVRNDTEGDMIRLSDIARYDTS
jgi:hypothetical protein